jgi:ATP-dependent protease ClpP protease subunit
MPYSNEHAARLKSPEMQHLRVRRTSGSGDGAVQGVKVPNSIDIIWYIIKTKDGEAPIAQTLRFPVKDWTSQAAKEWLTKNNIKYMTFEPAEKQKSEFEFKYVRDISEDTADIFIYGVIGEKIDGDIIAQEIYNLNRMGITTINERINSPGGIVLNGLSVVTANLNSQATINTYNDGVAASMAAIIWITGYNTYMADYARLMFHEPSIMGNTIENTVDEKLKRYLVTSRDSLSQIMQNRTGKPKEECDAIMEAETWYNAREAVESKLIKKSDIISNPKRPRIKSEMTTDEILLAVAATYNNDDNNNNSKTKKMEKIFSVLGLSAESTEQDAVSEIIAIKTSAKDGKDLVTIKGERDKLAEEKATALAEIDKLKVEKTEVETKITAKQTEVDALSESLLDTVIDRAIDSGVFVEKDSEGLKVQFKNNVEGLKFVIRNSASHAPNIIAQLNINPVENPKDKWGFAEWSKNDPKGLDLIRQTDKKRYNALGKAAYSSWIDEV